MQCIVYIHNKQGWNKSDCPSSWVFNITIFWKMCLFVLRLEKRGESSTTDPLERTSPYHWISIPSRPHTCWALNEANFSRILKCLLNLVQCAGKTVHMVLERETKHFHNNKITQPAYLHPILNWVDIKWLNNHWSLGSTYNGKHLTAVDDTNSLLRISESYMTTAKNMHWATVCLSCTRICVQK